MEPTLPTGEPEKKVKVQTSLEKLKLHCKVVADSGDFNEIAKYLPEDSTTNPSLLLQVASKPEFAYILQNSVKYGLENYAEHCQSKAKKNRRKATTKKPTNGTVAEKSPAAVYDKMSPDEQSELERIICDHLSVSFGSQILKKIPGYISTEVDASLSFDKEGTIARARRIIAMYNELGVPTNRVLIKIASTWEGIQAAATLRQSKINCNMTLIFNKTQAIACAQQDLFLISPFVGRILDWHKKNNPGEYVGASDPGVKSVTEIYNYFKKHGHKTIIMGASFRNISEIRELAGCDRLTISPALLKELEQSTDLIPSKLSIENAQKMDIPEVKVDQKTFRHDMNSDAMATEKLAEGIRKFEEDTNKLREIVRAKLVASTSSA